MTTPRREVILQQGARGRVIGLVRPDGSCPALEFLEGLDSRAQARFRALLEQLTDVGWLRAPELMRDLQVQGTPKVWEVKADVGPGFRLYLIHERSDWIATHGTPKPGRRQVASEVRRARALRSEWDA